MSVLEDCDIVVEAATENPQIKASIFKDLDEICKVDCILATNTSSISITEIASNTNRPEKVIGMHWGTVVLSLEPIMEPPKRFKDNASNFGFKREDAIIFNIGEVKKIIQLLN